MIEGVSGMPNNDERTMNYLKKDIEMLVKGIEGKRFDQINLDAVFGYLELLSVVVERVKAGITARDTFISYTTKPEEVSSRFAVEEGSETVEIGRHDERTVNFLKKDFLILLKGIDGKKLDEINLDQVADYIELLKNVIVRVKDGNVAKDTFISYTVLPEEWDSIFSRRKIEDTDLVSEEMDDDLLSPEANEEEVQIGLHDERTLGYLKSDFGILLKGLKDKRLEQINLDAIIEFLNMLIAELEDVKQGIVAPDHFFSRINDPEECSDIFKRDENATGDVVLHNERINERTMGYLTKDFSYLLMGVEGKRLDQLNLDAIIGYIEQLKGVIEDVKQGIVARDHFISRITTPEEMIDAFAKSKAHKL